MKYCDAKLTDKQQNLFSVTFKFIFGIVNEPIFLNKSRLNPPFNKKKGICCITSCVLSSEKIKVYIIFCTKWRGALKIRHRVANLCLADDNLRKFLSFPF